MRSILSLKDNIIKYKKVMYIVNPSSDVVKYVHSCRVLARAKNK